MTKQPGRRLYALSATIFSQDILDRVIDPAFSDMQIEYTAARARGAVWRRRWILVAGYVGIIKLLVICGWLHALRTARTWPADESRAFRRTVALTVTATACVTLLLLLPQLRFFHAHLLFYVIPHTLPFAIPLGVTFGVFCGLLGASGRPSARLRAAILLMALAGASVSFVSMEWIVPRADQAFEAELFKGTDPVRPAATSRAGQVRNVRPAATRTSRRGFPLEIRWALPCAPLALAMFALSVASRLRLRRSFRIMAGCSVGLVYLFLMDDSMRAGRQQMLPMVAAVWLPILLFVIASIGLRAGQTRPVGTAPDGS